MGQSEPGSKSAVLVVEDELLLRMLAIDAIEDAGFVALAANGSTEALGFLESRHDIRVVFTDIDMPGGVDGLELATIIRVRWPPIEIIITSGKRAPLATEMPARGLFLPKPYDLADVTAAMHRMTQ